MPYDPSNDYDYAARYGAPPEPSPEEPVAPAAQAPVQPKAPGDLSDEDYQKSLQSLRAKGVRLAGDPAPPGSEGGEKPKSNKTIWHQAGTPSAPGEPEMSWGEVGSKALSNAIPSAFGAVNAAASGILHPIDTAKALAAIAYGGYSQAKGAMGFEHNPEDEKLIGALEDHYKNVYGSIAGFKKALAEDPAGILMDASTFLGGAGAVGKVAGLEKIAGAAGKAASIVDKLNPVARAGQLAVGAAKLPVNIARGAMSKASGVSTYAQQVATKIGSMTGKAGDAMRDAYNRFARGEGDPTEWVSKSESALKQDKQAAVNDYIRKKGSLQPGAPSFQPVEDAIAAARQETQLAGPGSAAFQNANSAIDQVEQLVKEHKYGVNGGSPVQPTIHSFDNLKQAIGDLMNGTNNPAAQRHLGAIYNSVKGSIRAIDPAYDDLMEKYSTAMSGVNDAKKLLIGGDKTGATASMAKALRSIKDTTGVNMLERMAKYEPTLPAMLAGHAVNPATAGVTHTIQDMIAGSILGHGVHPVVGAATMIAGSPKVVGALNYGAGRLGALTGIAPASRAVSKVVKALPKNSTYYAGNAERENEPEALSEAPAAAPDKGADTYSKILHQESNNKQFDEKGNPKTSSAGAIGAAQIMPGTGPEAARLAGEDWDENRFRNDADYNRKLGKAYFEHLKDMFGDERHAVAAYNAGPQRVKDALADAHFSGKDFLEHLPEETRNYVHSVTGRATGGRVGRASGGRL